MGKSNAKPTIKCPSSIRHKPHTYTAEIAQTEDGVRVSDFTPVRAWCPGEGHVHAWEREEGSQPILRSQRTMKQAGLGEQGVPWNGPFECSCGMSKWLSDGKVKGTTDRFPDVDPMQRIMDIKWRLEAGAELDEDDREEIRLISEALIKAFEPLIEAFTKMFEMVAAALTAFIDDLPPEVKAQMSELLKAYGEKPDNIETVDLVTDAGDTMATIVIGHEPMSAKDHAAQVEEIANLGISGVSKLLKRQNGHMTDAERDEANFEATGVEPDFWDDRTTPLAYSEQDSERDLARRRESLYAYNELFGNPLPTHPWFRPDAIEQVRRDIDRQG